MTSANASLLDPEAQTCPHQFFAKLRKQAKVHHMPDMGLYFITDYALGRKVLVDSRRFAKKTAENDGRRYIEPNEAAQEILRTKDVGTPISLMAQKDGKEHRDYRSIVNAYFQSGAVRPMAAYVAETSAKLLGDIAAGSVVDVVDAYGVPLPVYVIADMLGVPRSEYRRFKAWSDAVLTYTAVQVGEEEAIAGAELMVEMHKYMLEQIELRRRERRDDLLNVLAYAEYEGRPLTDRELCGFTDELLVAGNETTTNAFAAGMLQLASEPDLQARLRAEPDNIEKFVEEVLRVGTPLQVTLRYALEDVEVGEVTIPKGSKVFVGLASANRDECIYADAERINLDRENVRPHITFGAGEHHCLGAELARLELRIAFAAWLSKFKSITLAQSKDSIAYPKSYAVRGPLGLKLRVE